MKSVVRSSAGQIKALTLAAALNLIPHGAFATSPFNAYHLTIPVDARTEAMGRAWAPLSTTAFAAWSNVGGLAMSPALNVSVNRWELVPEYPIVHWYGTGLACMDRGTWRVGLDLNYSYLTYGSVQATSGGSVDPYSDSSPTEHTWGLAPAASFGNEKVRVGLGAGFKWVKVDLTTNDSISGTDGDTFTLDLGTLASWRILWNPQSNLQGNLLFGFALSNLAGHIGQNGSELPKMLRSSIGMEFSSGQAATFFDVLKSHPRLPLVSGALAIGVDKDLWSDVLPSCSEDSSQVCTPVEQSYWEKHYVSRFVGAEVGFLGSFFGRLGYMDDQVAGQANGSTWGAGVSILGYVGMDWARVLEFDNNYVNRYSFWARVPW